MSDIINDYIRNVRVYDLAESIVASRFPMAVKNMSEEDFEKETKRLQSVIDSDFMVLDDKRIKTALNLGGAKPASGHDTWLKGVRVSFNLYAPQFIWQQLKRYRFLDFTSSESSMHCILKFQDLDERFYRNTPKESIQVLKDAISSYNENPTEDNFDTVVNSIPSGFMLMARLSTNYLQLKTIYNQRKNHKLKFYRKVIIPWILSLPLFTYIVNKENANEV